MGTATRLQSLLDPLSGCFDVESARRLADFRIDPTVQERIDTLGEQANQGCLSAEERDEYDALISAADFISILKLKARRRLDQPAQ